MAQSKKLKEVAVTLTRTIAQFETIKITAVYDVSEGVELSDVTNDIYQELEVSCKSIKAQNTHAPKEVGEKSPPASNPFGTKTTVNTPPASNPFGTKTTVNTPPASNPFDTKATASTPPASNPFDTKATASTPPASNPFDTKSKDVVDVKTINKLPF